MSIPSNPATVRYTRIPNAAPEKNFDWEFVRSELDRAKVSVIVVETKPCEQFFKQTRFGREIGDGLWRTGLGRFSGSLLAPKIQNIFHVHADLRQAALEFIQCGLRHRGLLERSRIAHADSELELWRTFYPRKVHA